MFKLNKGGLSTYNTNTDNVIQVDLKCVQRGSSMWFCVVRLRVCTKCYYVVLCSHIKNVYNFMVLCRCIERVYKVVQSEIIYRC